MNWFRYVLLLCLLQSCFLSFGQINDQSETLSIPDTTLCCQYPTIEQNYILILNSYSREDLWGNQVKNEIVQSVFGPNVTGIYIEHLDAVRKLPYSQCIEAVQSLFTKYTRQPQAIVILGTLGWDLYRKTAPHDWKDIQVILASVRDSLFDFQAYKNGVPFDQLPAVSLKKSCEGFKVTVVGTKEVTTPTIKLMQKVLPDIKQVAFIIDDSFISQCAKRYITAFQANHKKLSYLFLDKSHLTTQQMLDSISKLDSTTGVIFFSWQLEPNDPYYHSNPFILYKYITTLLKIPPFIVADLNFYNGLFAGGCFISAADIGLAISAAVEDVIQNKDSNFDFRTMSISDRIKQRLDYRVLKQFHIPTKQLLKDSSIIFTNKPLSFLEKNRKQVMLICLITILVFVALLYYQLLKYHRNKQRKREAEILKETSDLRNNMPILYARIKFIYHSGSNEIDDLVIVNRNHAFKKQIEEQIEIVHRQELYKRLININLQGGFEHNDQSKRVRILKEYQEIASHYYQIHQFPATHPNEFDLFFVDVTELALAERKISDYRERIVNLYKDLPIAVALFNQEFFPVDCNEDFCELLEITSDDFKRFDSYHFPLFSDEEIRSILRGNHTSREIIIDQEKLVKLRSHQVYHIDRTIWCVIEPIYLDNKEKIDTYALLFIDHTGVSSVLAEIERISQLNRKTLMEILENLPVAVAIKDADDDYKYVYWNRENIDLMHLSGDDAISKNDKELFPDSYQLFRKEDYQLLLKERRQIYRESNEHGHQLLTRKCVISGPNEHRWILITRWDITSRREAEKQLELAKESAERAILMSKLVLDNIDIGIVYMDLNYVVQWNSLSNLRNILTSDFFECGQLCYKSYNKRKTICAKCPMKEMFRKMQPVTAEKFINDVYLEATAYPVFGKTGELIGGVLRLVNITEQKHYEQKLRENAICLSLALSLGNILPWSWSLDTNKINFYDKDQYDFRNYTILSHNDLLNTIDPEHRESYQADMDRFKKGELTILDCTLRSSIFATEYQWYRVQGIAFEKTKGGVVKRAIGVLQNISDSKRNEQELIIAKEKAEESNRLKSAFLASMSHEIRTPLNAIVGFSEVLIEAETEEERQMYANHIAMNNDILLQLISDILDISKIESETLDFVYTQVDINAILRGIEAQTKLRLDHTKVELRVKTGIKSCIISTEKNRLVQLISNLVQNAIKFTQEGYIALGYDLTKDRKWLRFYVSDTGCGIEQTKLAMVFDRFVQLNDFAQGTGLGLAICKTIVERLGGTIGVESQVNVGTTFWFTIPYTVVLSNEKTLSILPHKSSGSVEVDFHHKPLLLIAEDTKSNFILFETILKHQYRLIHAIDGIEAVRLFRESKPDLILMDLKMPRMNGYEATRIIRDENHAIPIIAITAFAFADDEEQIMKNGFSGFITKPIKRNEFLTLINEQLRVHQKMK